MPPIIRPAGPGIFCLYQRLLPRLNFQMGKQRYSTLLNIKNVSYRIIVLFISKKFKRAILLFWMSLCRLIRFRCVLTLLDRNVGVK